MSCGVLSAEIAAIATALKYAQEHLKQVQQLVVFSDSQQALRAIQAGNDARTGRALLSKIAESIETLCRAGIDLRFRWSPGHEGVVGNEEADDAAREASSHTGKPTAPALERVREVAGVIRLINRDRSEDPTPFDTTRLPGQYTWKLDQALPGKHTLQLYGSLTSDQASILIQARTGHCRLNQYLSRAGLVDDAKFCLRTKQSYTPSYHRTQTACLSFTGPNLLKTPPCEGTRNFYHGEREVSLFYWHWPAP
jgi:hypothetical protein